jgi:hypothetical protein
MHKEFIGEIASLVIYEGILLPRKIRVVLTDTKSTPGRRKPSAVLIYEVMEERAKCVSVTFTAGKDNASISSSELAKVDIDGLWLEAAQTLALQYKADAQDELEIATPKRGRAAAKRLADNVGKPSKMELMLIGYHYSNPLNQKSPTKAVQLSMGYGSRATAIRRIEEARKKGWVLPLGSSEKKIKKHFEQVKAEVEKSK